MRVNVAGAGAGKTTHMAERITEYEVPEGKMLFCIAFTNAAADNIREKVEKKLGVVPANIKISTIHSFLHQELVKPFYFLLYGKHFEKLSTINLPEKVEYRQKRISDLEKNGILHITKIPEKAKWVVYQKSNDTRAIRNKRRAILSHFASCCAAIFIDEAQDISEDINVVIDALDKKGIEIILFGDPKQDIKGFGCFRRIIDKSDSVKYFSVSHRCPQIHLDLSNLLAKDAERQIANAENETGSIFVVFESDIEGIENVKEFIKNGKYGLQYISSKRDRYSTHEKGEDNKRFQTLFHEIYHAMSEKWTGKKSEIVINRSAYNITDRMLKSFDASGDVKKCISQWKTAGAFDQLSSQQYARMANAFSLASVDSSNIVVVNSIEIVKGLEAKRCLFILTTDLAPYLFRDKTEDNKMSHLLYVALTRSSEHLTILITKEVEDNYSKDGVISFFKQRGVL